MFMFQALKKSIVKFLTQFFGFLWVLIALPFNLLRLLLVISAKLHKYLEVEYKQSRRYVGQVVSKTFKK